MSNKGWECPVCGKGVAPGEKTCDHGNGQTVYPPVYIPEPYPVYPSPAWPLPPYTWERWICGAEYMTTAELLNADGTATIVHGPAVTHGNC